MFGERDSSTLRAVRRARARAARRGMTLIEIMVVMVIIVLVLGAVVFGSGQLGSSRLKHTATAISGAVRVAFTRATATSKPQRLVFDLDDSTMWLEEGNAPMLVQSKDTAASGGADPVTNAERLAIAEKDSIVKGPQVARPHFHAVSGISITEDTEPRKKKTEGEGEQAAPSASGSAAPAAPAPGKGPISLPRGIKFREVQTAHDDAPRTNGRAYLYFWPGGMTERADIQIRIGDSTEDGDTLSLLVSPLTGKITVKNGPAPLVLPKDDKEASEREDRGF